MMNKRVRTLDLAVVVAVLAVVATLLASASSAYTGAGGAASFCYAVLHNKTQAHACMHEQ
jgi:hypothetical protein